MIIGGGQNVHTSFKNRKVTEVEISSLTTSKPDSEWLRLKGGKLDVMNATYTSSFGVGDAKEIYVPLVAPSEDSSQSTIRVLVLTKDPDLLKFTNDSRKLEKDNASAAQVLKFLAASAEKMRVTRDVEGLVQYGIEGGGKKERKIRGLYTNLSPDVIILEEGTKPSMMLGLGMLIGGWALGFVLVISSGKTG